jgi:hypothetical protein
MKFSYARNRHFRRSKEAYYFCILCKLIYKLLTLVISQQQDSKSC